MHPVLTPLGYAQAQEALYSDSIIVHMNAGKSIAQLCIIVHPHVNAI